MGSEDHKEDSFPELMRVLREMTAHVARLQNAMDLFAARTVAQQAAIHALISTHDDPRDLFDKFASLIDVIGNVESVVEDEILRTELHRVQTHILQIVNTK